MGQAPTAAQLQAGMNSLATAGNTGGYSSLLTAATNLVATLFVTPSPYNDSTQNLHTPLPTTNQQYVTDLYNTYLQRDPDSGGLTGWTNDVVTNGRAHTQTAFATSAEFYALVQSLYGDDGGDDTRTQHFVNDFYYGATQAAPSTTVLNSQVAALDAAAENGQAAVTAQAQSMGNAIFASQVTASPSTLSDAQFVTNLYEAFLQRGPDESGFNFWVGQAAGSSTNRQNVLTAFSTSTAFEQLAGTLYRELYWVTPDHLGTPRMIIDKSGSLASVKRHDYLPFGEELPAGLGGRSSQWGYVTDDVRQKFTSKERDGETGLDYFGARYYAGMSGRFTSVDPIKLTPGRLLQPQRLNLYSYTINNPVSLIDPDGKDISFINDTKEGRRKALLSITANMTASEAKNVGIKYNKDTHRYEGYIKDASKIDLSKASQGYQDFSDRVNNHDLQLNYALIGKSDSVTIELNGIQTNVTQKTLAGAGGDTTGFVAPQSDGSFAVIVSEKGYPPGVAGLTASGRETTIAMPNFILAAHELFAETYKYTPEGTRRGLNREENVVDDSDEVIKIENKYRDFHGLPHRSGTDHGYIHAGTVTVRP